MGYRSIFHLDHNLIKLFIRQIQLIRQVSSFIKLRVRVVVVVYFQCFNRIVLKFGMSKPIIIFRFFEFEPLLYLILETMEISS